MANRGPNTNDSQFFVTEEPVPHLNNLHTIFGDCTGIAVIRKIARVPSLEGLTIETTILLPLAGGYLALLASTGTMSFGNVDLRTDLLLSFAGIITALPLLWFAHAVQRLRLATIGVLQYISPTIQFLFAVFLFHEPFGREHFVAFAFIWLALAIYSGSNLLIATRGVAVPAPEPN